MTAKRRTTAAELFPFAADLMTAPAGEWYPIPTVSRNPSSLVSRQRRGEIPALPPERYESRRRGNIAYARRRVE